MYLPDCITQEIADKWAKYRREDCKGKKFTENMREGFYEKCVNYHEDGYDVPRLISHAKDVGWLTIWPVETCRRTKRPLSHSTAKVVQLPTSDKKTAQRGLAAMREAL